jgi:hypothetical protein
MVPFLLLARWSEAVAEVLAATSEEILIVGVVGLAACALMMAIACIAMLPRQPVAPLEARGEQGHVMLSLVMTVPILAFCLLLLVQCSLIGSAMILTRYAAFSGARSAIVQLSESKGGWFGMGPHPERYRPKAISEAVWIALSPMSPAERSTSASPVGAELQKVVQRFGLPYRYDAAQRYRSAASRAVVSTDPAGPIGTPQMVQAKVVFNLPLTVPIVGRLLANGGTRRQPTLRIVADAELWSTGAREHSLATWAGDAIATGVANWISEQRGRGGGA